MPIAVSTCSRRPSSSMRFALQRDEVTIERRENLIERAAEGLDGSVERSVGRRNFRLVILLDQRVAGVLFDAHLDRDRHGEGPVVAAALVAPDSAVNAQSL